MAVVAYSLEHRIVLVALDLARLHFAVAEVLHRRQDQVASSDLAGCLVAGSVGHSRVEDSIAGSVVRYSTGAVVAVGVGVALASVLVGPSSVAGHLGLVMAAAKAIPVGVLEEQKPGSRPIDQVDYSPAVEMVSQYPVETGCFVEVSDPALESEYLVAAGSTLSEDVVAASCLDHRSSVDPGDSGIVPGRLVLEEVQSIQIEAAPHRWNLASVSDSKP